MTLGPQGGNSYRLVTITKIGDFSTEVSGSEYRADITASDNHGLTTNLPVTVSISDNAAPTVNNQESNDDFNENPDALDGGIAYDNQYQIVASDVEGNPITFGSLHLKQVLSASVQIDDSSSFVASDPFQVNSTGLITKVGVGAPLARVSTASEYRYQVTVQDAFNPFLTGSGFISISIDTDVTPTTIVESNGSGFIVESAQSGDYIAKHSSGIVASNNGAQMYKLSSTVDTNPDETEFDLSSSALFEPIKETDPIKRVRLVDHISGTYFSGDTITLGATASTTFDSESGEYLTARRGNFTITVTEDPSPTVTFTDVNSGNNLNTNEARAGGERLFELDFTTGSTNGVANANIDLTTFNLVDTSGNFVSESPFIATSTGFETFISASTNIAAGTYQLTASIGNTNAIRTGSDSVEFTITQSPPGS